MESIFKHEIAGHICYSRSVEDRIREVKDCTDIKALKNELETMPLQVTVDKTIRARIRKLERGVN